MKEADIRKPELVDQMLRLAKEDVNTFFSDTSTFKEIGCPACSESSYRQCFQKESFQYVLCNGCETLYVNPRPSFEHFVKFYRDGISAKFFAKDFFPPVAESRRQMIFRPRAQALSPLVKQNDIKRVGDIGAGFGIFCEELRHLFPHITIEAIEPEETMADICRRKGFGVIEKTLEEIDEDIAPFDLLTAFELMEHLHTPRIFIEKVNTLLKSGGYFLFTTLNIDGFDLQVLWDTSKSIAPPHHINFINPKAARKLVEDCGLEVVEITTPGKLDVDIVYRRYKEDGTIPHDRFWKLFFDRCSEKTRDIFQELLIKDMLSSHMWVLARKR